MFILNVTTFSRPRETAWCCRISTQTASYPPAPTPRLLLCKSFYPSARRRFFRERNYIQPLRAAVESSLSGSVPEKVKILRSPSDIGQFLDGIDTFLLDCDGVLWHAYDMLPGTRETLRLLRRLGKRVFFVTNNSTKSRKQYAETFQKLNITDVSPEDIICSSFAAASYLHSMNFSKKAYVVGEEGIIQELVEHEISFVDGRQHNDERCTASIFSGMPVDPDIGAVVVGYDSGFNYYKLAYAALHLTQVPNCALVATNLDSADLVDGRLLPGGGCMVAAIDTARMASHVDAAPLINVGKPESFTLDMLVEKHRLNRSRTCVIGDRLDTDILYGRNGGMRTALVLTGIATSSQLTRTPSTSLPHFILPAFADLQKASS